MSSSLSMAVVLIKFALIFYSLGVGAERTSLYLKPWHVAAFRIRFTFEVAGTIAIHLIAKKPFDITEPYALNGQADFWLMLFHSVWAVRVVINKKVILLRTFHCFSIFVWVKWLVSYFGEMFL